MHTAVCMLAKLFIFHGKYDVNNGTHTGTLLSSRCWLFCLESTGSRNRCIGEVGQLWAGPLRAFCSPCPIKPSYSL